ncbi:MAG: FmdB family zinc ribbon protein [Gemmatimonadales bacterium]
MPTYEFTCPNGHDFDKFFRSMASAPTVVPCPVCGKPADRQMSAGAGLVFHGTGFYITDYGKDGKKDQNSAARRRTESAPDASGESGSSASAGSASSQSETKAESGSATAAPSDTKSGGDSATATPAAPAKPVASPKASE